MDKLTMLQKMKSRHGEGVLIFFRSDDNFEAYYEDAERVARILEVELTVVDSVPTVLVSRNDTDKLLDAGYGIILSMVMDREGRFTPTISEGGEILHLYDDC